jgi:orotate phosphoribosyltransferase
MTGGYCTKEYYRMTEMTSFPYENMWFAKQHVAELRRYGVKGVDFVLGSAYAAIPFSYSVAQCLGARHVFAEKGPDGKMIWGRFELPKGATVVMAEDSISTFGTAMDMYNAVIENNRYEVKFLPIVGTILHRPPKLPVEYFFNDELVTVVPLIEKQVWAVPQKECPLCAAGSERLPPKTNWAKLTGADSQ